MPSLMNNSGHFLPPWPRFLSEACTRSHSHLVSASAGYLDPSTNLFLSTSPCLPASLLTHCLLLFLSILLPWVLSYLYSPLSRLLTIVLCNLLSVSHSCPLGQAMVPSVSQSPRCPLLPPSTKKGTCVSGIVIGSSQILKYNSYLEYQNIQAESTLNEHLVQLLTVHIRVKCGLEIPRLGEGLR